MKSSHLSGFANICFLVWHFTLFFVTFLLNLFLHLYFCTFSYITIVTYVFLWQTGLRASWFLQTLCGWIHRREPPAVWGSSVLISLSGWTTPGGILTKSRLVCCLIMCAGPKKQKNTVYSHRLYTTCTPALYPVLRGIGSQPPYDPTQNKQLDG